MAREGGSPQARGLDAASWSRAGAGVRGHAGIVGPDERLEWGAWEMMLVSGSRALKEWDVLYISSEVRYHKTLRLR